MVPLNEIYRMSLAPHPMPRALVAAPNYAQGQLDCPDHLDCASDRQHAEKSDQAQQRKQPKGSAKGSNRSRFIDGPLAVVTP
jgi:hypothetical protein